MSNDCLVFSNDFVMKNMFQDAATQLTVQQIRTFCCVYQLGGYAPAGLKLGMSSPTIWEHVKVLERVYRVTLFEKEGRAIRPTIAGHELYGLLSPLLVGLESTFPRLDERLHLSSGPISLVTGVRMLMEELGQPLREFLEQHPQTQLRLLTADNALAQEYVLEEKVDLALLIEPPHQLSIDGIRCRRLYPIEYLAIFPESHPLLKKRVLRLQDILNEPLVLGNAKTLGRQLFEQALFRLGLCADARIAAETDNSAMTIACVRAGLGIGIIAGRREGDLIRSLGVRTLAPEMGQVFVVAAFKSGQILSQTIEALLETIARCTSSKPLAS